MRGTVAADRTSPAGRFEARAPGGLCDDAAFALEEACSFDSVAP
jgi:hypothetical protein